MTTLITVIHIVTCVFIVLVVLMQSGKGAEISAQLGGSSQTVFGSSGGANFFTKLTYVLAAVFMTTSLMLTIISSKSKKSVFDGAPLPVTTSGAPTTETTPATTTDTASKSEAAKK